MLSRPTSRLIRISSCGREAQATFRSQPTRQFTQLQQRRDLRAPAAQESPKGSREHHGNQQQAPRGYIRPFTILFICIPFGYGANWALKNQNPAGQTSPDGFVKYMLASREDISSTCSIFSLIPSSPSAAIDLHAPDLARSITSVQFKQPQLQIARSYTLLPPTADQDPDEIRFLIRREQKGEVSGYLHRLPLDAEVEVRGTSREYVVPQDVDRVVFLAGGTGIAPAMQVASMLKDDKADVHILWANRKREDCAGGTSDTQIAAFQGPWWSLSRLWTNASSASGGAAKTVSLPTQQKHQIVRELDDAKHSHDGTGRELRVDYFVDEEGTFIQPKAVDGFLQDHTPGKKLLIVSGPEGFIAYWAGPKQWLNGREAQGPLAGALGRMDTTDWEIVKL